MFTAALFPSYSKQGPLSSCGARSHCGGSVTEHGLRGRGGGGLQQFWILGSRAQAQQLWQMGLTALWHVGSSQNRDQTSLQHWQANSSPLNHQQTLYLFLIIPFFISVARYLNGHELGQTPGDDEGQGSLACCSPWVCKEPDPTEHAHTPVVRTQHFHCQGLSLIPDRGTKSPLAAKLDHNNNNVAYLVDRLNMNMCNPLLF